MLRKLYLDPAHRKDVFDKLVNSEMLSFGSALQIIIEALAEAQKLLVENKQIDCDRRLRQAQYALLQLKERLVGAGLIEVS